MQARLVLVVETTNEQSISFCFDPSASDPSASSSSTSPSSRPENQSTASGVAQDMRAKAGEAISKVTDAAQQAGSQAAAASLASDASQKAKGFLNMQVSSGSDLAGHVARSVHSAADSLDQNAPQLASLARAVRPSAWSSFREISAVRPSRTWCEPSEFTRRQPPLLSSAWRRSRASRVPCAQEQPSGRGIPRAQERLSGRRPSWRSQPRSFGQRAGQFHGT